MVSVTTNQDGEALPPPEFKPDDDQLAIELAHHWKNQVRYFYGGWHVYEDGTWTERQMPEVNLEVRKFLREYRRYGIAVSRRRVSSLASMAEDDCFVPDRKLNDLYETKKRFINLRNGLFNLDTMELEPHEPNLYFTSSLDFDYEPKAKPNVLFKYLRTSLVDDGMRTDESMIRMVQEALAYSMTARTDMKASFWLVGKPDSGKSTLVSFIRSLMGSLHTTIDLNQLGTNRFLLSSIVGKRCVTFTEASANTVLPDAIYKAMVGGEDEIYADVKNRPGISFVPEAKFWWAMNESPRITDRSGATFNRLNVVLFNRTIPKEERIANLPQLLSREKAGIFNWLMQGYKRLNEQGKFTRPEQSAQWIDNYRAENDTEWTFIEDRFELDKDSRVQSQVLYDTYQGWCNRNGFHAKNVNQASKEWERLGFEKQRSGGRSYWQGLRMKSEI
jgi:putative DNA primase/helicase